MEKELAIQLIWHPQRKSQIDEQLGVRLRYALDERLGSRIGYMLGDQFGRQLESQLWSQFSGQFWCQQIYYQANNSLNLLFWR